MKWHNLKAVLAFVEFGKPFNRIPRGRTLLILRAYDVPDRIVSAIGLIYNGTWTPILTPDGKTGYLEILAGVLQGDTLAPFLFAILLDYTTRQTIAGKEETLGSKLDRRRSRRQHPTVNTDTDFAVDIALTLFVPCTHPLYMHSNNQRHIYTSCRCFFSSHWNCLWATKYVYTYPKLSTSATT